MLDIWMMFDDLCSEHVSQFWGKKSSPGHHFQAETIWRPRRVSINWCCHLVLHSWILLVDRLGVVFNRGPEQDNERRPNGGTRGEMNEDDFKDATFMDIATDLLILIVWWLESSICAMQRYMFKLLLQLKEQIAPPCSIGYPSVSLFDPRQHGAVPIVEMLQVSDTKLQDSVLKVSHRDSVGAWGDRNNPWKHLLLPECRRLTRG